MSDSTTMGAPGPASEDPELAAALDSFVDWAVQDGESAIPGLPPVDLGEGIGPGTLLGDFELVRRLGMGGMSVVFEARQRSVSRRRVAVKVLRNLFASEQLAERFRREIATIAQLDHPAIVPIVDARIEAGTPFYAMKFVEGMSAARIVRELRQGAGVPRTTGSVRTSLEGAAARETSEESSASDAGSVWEESYLRWVARVGLLVAEALQYAHENGVVHRDVKPGNVMITPQGSPVLVDFGLASTEGDESLTRTGDFLGTLAYASPEQLRGEEVDTRGDVYSLGATLFELCTLSRPHEAHNRSELLRRVEEDTVPDMDSWIPRDLRTILTCALSRSPRARYATPGLMAHDLRAFLADQPIRARPPGVWTRAIRAVRRRPRLATGVVVAVLALLALRGRSHVEARERVGAGSVLVERYESAISELNEAVAGFDLALVEEPPDFHQVEGLRTRIESERADAALAFDEAEAELLRAFEHVAGHTAARNELARLHAARLRQALRDHEDLYRPERLANMEESLRLFGDKEEYARLLDPQGWIALSCEEPDARVRVEAQGGGVGREFSLPLERLELPEGSYQAWVSAPGFSEAVLPFVVRRDACYDEPGARPARELSLSLLRPEDVGAGFVHVPGGETLVADEPPLWRHVPSFLMQRYEVTYADLIGWLGEHERAGFARLQPLRFPGKVAGLPREGNAPHLVRAETGEWRCVDGVAHPDWPVRGLTPMEMSELASELELVAPAQPSGWSYSLPTVDERIRAGRGADARAYPWGRTFDWQSSSNYVSGDQFGRDARPAPVGSNPDDVSLFGIHDLAGSVREITGDNFYPLPGVFCAVGGSFRSVDPRDAETCFVQGVGNEPEKDLGFRLVKRPLPEWMRVPDEEPREFFDDFERPDGPDVGNGWAEVAGAPLAITTNAHEPENCSIASGRLVCQGGLGDFSESSSAWRRIHVRETGFVLSATVRGSCKGATDLEEAVSLRTFGLISVAGFLPGKTQYLSLVLSYRGEPRLRYGFGSDPWQDRDSPPIAPEGPLCFEIRVRDSRAEGRIWPRDEPRPASPTLEIELPPDFEPPRYLGFTAHTGIGARVEVDEARVALDG